MKTAIVLAAVILLSFAPVASQDECAISLDHVDGLFTGNKIPVSDNEVTFWLRLTNNSPNKVKALTNGFEISGSDPSVIWNVTEYDAIPLFANIFDLYWVIDTFSLDGALADTIGYSGAILATGLPPGFDEPSYWITLVVDDPASAGHQICLDSCYYPPSGDWMWAYGAAGSIPPSWDGPHCFDIYSCCDGMRGNIDCSSDNLITISDLVYLAGYMFGGEPAPLDMATADFFDDGQVDIADLVYLVDYMFTGGIPPADCP